MKTNISFLEGLSEEHVSGWDHTDRKQTMILHTGLQVEAHSTDDSLQIH